MQHRNALRIACAAVTFVAATLCLAAENVTSLVLVLIASATVIALRPFGEAPSALHVATVTMELSEARSGVEVASPTNALVSILLIAMPGEQRNSRIALPFALLFRDEIAGVKWRSLATRLRMQRRSVRAPK